MKRLLPGSSPATTALMGAFLWLALGPLLVTMPQSGLVDDSWRSVLVHAWVHGWRWGVDVIDNFGPYGFLYVQEFHPHAVVVMLALNGLLAGVLAIAWCSVL